MQNDKFRFWLFSSISTFEAYLMLNLLLKKDNSDPI